MPSYQLSLRVYDAQVRWMPLIKLKIKSVYDARSDWKKQKVQKFLSE